MKRLDPTAVVHILVVLLFLLNLKESGQAGGQNYLDFNLEDEVATPTVPRSSCAEFKRRSLSKRSLNASSHDRETNLTAETTVTPATTEETEPDDCLVYRDTCPEEVKISWLHAAPFVYDISSARMAKNETIEPRPAIQIMKGIFHEIVTRAIGSCCKKLSGSIPTIRYLKRAANLRDLQYSLLHGRADVIIPVESDEVKYLGTLPYVKILDSPGVVLIRRHQSSTTEWKLLFEAILGTWPVVLIAFLMSSVAGVFMWALDSTHNSKQFPRAFHHGAFEGFWWAFVTITTVGYGDKAPRSTLARSFAVLWIIIGVTVCSVMTATLSSALTSVKIEKYDVTTGKRIGVLRDSSAFQDAVNLAANITTLEDPDEMYEALKNGDGIDGILEELFSGVESMKRRDTSNQLTVAKFIWRNRAFGVAYRDNLFTKAGSVTDCLSNVIKFRYNDVLKITSNYIRATEAVENEKLSSVDVEDDAINVFDFKSLVFLACVIALSLFLIAVLVGGTLNFFITKNRSDQKDRRSSATSGNDTTSKGHRCSRRSYACTCSSVCSNGQQHTEV